LQKFQRDFSSATRPVRTF